MRRNLSALLVLLLASGIRTAEPADAPMAEPADTWMAAGQRAWQLAPIPGRFTVTWAPGAAERLPPPSDAPQTLAAAGATLARLHGISAPRYRTDLYAGPPAADPFAVAAALRRRPDVATAAPLYQLAGGHPDVWRAATDRVLVKLDDPSLLREQQDLELLRPFGLTPGQWMLRVRPGVDPVAAAWRLHNRPEVDWAQVDWLQAREPRYIPDDPRFEDQWHLDNTGQGGGTAGEDLGMVQAWDTSLGTGAIIAVLDSGIDSDHPDLAGVIRPGWDVLDGDDNPDPGSQSSHGTRVSGVAAAPANGIGVVGSCADCTIIPVRMLGASDSGEAEAIDFAVAGGAWVINNSWGPPDGLGTEHPLPDVVRAAIENATSAGRSGLGTVIFWASGNGHPVDSCGQDGYVAHPHTLGVGASTDGGLVSPFSERCPELEFSAPSAGGASEVTTTTLGNPSDPTAGYTSGFGGTSAAAPGAAGAGAVVLAAWPTLTWRELRSVLRSTAQHLEPSLPAWADGHTDEYGYGRIDATAALDADPVFLTTDEAIACGDDLHVRLHLVGVEEQSPVVQIQGGTELLELPLVEGPAAVYTGTPGTSEALDPDDGLLAVADGDTVTVSAPGVPPATVAVDCRTPSLLSAQADGLGPYSGRVAWTFDEPSFGQASVGGAALQPSESGFGIEHRRTLLTLTPCREYRVDIVGVDGVGNTVTVSDALVFQTPGDTALLPPDAPVGADPCTWTDGDDDDSGDDDDATPPDRPLPSAACSGCQGGPGSAWLLLPLFGLRGRRRGALRCGGCA